MLYTSSLSLFFSEAPPNLTTKKGRLQCFLRTSGILPDIAQSAYAVTSLLPKISYTYR